MKKYLALTLIFLSQVLFSCGSDEEVVKEPVQSKPFKPTSIEELEKKEPKKVDTVYLKDTVVSEPKATFTSNNYEPQNPNYIRVPNNYSCKHAELIQHILTMKRDAIMEKEQKPHSFYGDWFFDIFEIETAPIILIQYYEKKIDLMITEAVSKGELNYLNLEKGIGSPVK